MISHRIDFNSISIEEFCKETNSRLKNSTQGKYRDAIDAMRTIAWYVSIEKITGLKRPHQLEKQLEPESFSANEYGETVRRNKWRQYRAGRHTPSDQFISKISCRLKPQATNIFHHVLWRILREENLAADNWLEWLKEIPKSISKIFIKEKAYKTLDTLIGEILSARNLGKLELHADINALALLTIALKHAIHTQKFKQAQDLSRIACRIFLLSGFDIFCNMGIAQPLFDYYERTFLSKSIYEGCFISFPPVKYRYLIGRLLDAMHNLEDVNYHKLSKVDINKYQKKILSADYGFDYLYLFKPIEIPSSTTLILDDPKVKRYQAALGLWKWADTAWLNPSSRNTIPDHVWDKFRLQ